MRKLTSLRAALMAALPELRNEPARLKLWVENGAVRARGTASHGFALQYPLSVLIEEAKTDIAIIALAITRWLRVNQPDLLAPNGDSFQFESDILDLKTADILFTINLTENVAVAPNPDGSWAVNYLPEPDPLFEDALGFSDPIPDLVGVWLDEQVVAPGAGPLPPITGNALLGGIIVPPSGEVEVPEAEDILSFIANLDGETT
jgi:hypothetical protein